MLYFYIIYKLTFPNGKVYIGQTSQDFNYYMNRYKSNFLNKNFKGNNRIIYKAIKHFGWNNIKREILFTTSAEFVDELETKIIAEYNATDRRFGYNILEIGKSSKGFKHSEETKKKIKNANSGKNNGMYGKHHTTDIINFISINNKNWHKNNIHPMLGKTHSEETKQKQREANLGKKHPEKYKSISVYTKTMKYIKTFESIKQTSEELKIYRTNIIAVLKNRRKSAGGYIFKYAEKI